jgi:hypothetical protein
MKKCLLYLLPGLFLLGSCSNDGTKPEGDDSASKDSLGKTETTVETEETVSYTLPSPLQVAALFKKSGLKYLPGITHNPGSASTYSGKFKLAQNMGVYSSDMAYTVLNKQNNEAIKYLKTIREVAGQLNMGKVFDNGNLYDRFNKNLDSEDSLRSIIAEMQMESDMLMAENDQKHLYGIIYSGAWIESMYIGAQVYNKNPESKIVPKLLEQMTILNNIIKELKANESKEPAITGLLADFTDLQNTFTAIPSVKAVIESEEIDFTKVEVKKEELNSLFAKIEAIRKKIINA